MAMAERSGQVVWKGNLSGGAGKVTGGSSGAFTDLEVTWASRTKRAEGKTSPEELIAAAHASCFSMALSHELDQMGHAPEVLEVEAIVTLDEVDGAPTVTSSALRVDAQVPGIEEMRFVEAAKKAKKGCPVSRALQRNVEVSMETNLNK